MGDCQPKDKTDMKAQVPSDTPIAGQLGQGGNDEVFGRKTGNVGPSNQHGNVVVQLAEKPGLGEGVGVNGQPVAEVSGNGGGFCDTHADDSSLSMGRMVSPLNLFMHLLRRRTLQVHPIHPCRTEHTPQTPAPFRQCSCFGQQLQLPVIWHAALIRQSSAIK